MNDGHKKACKSLIYRLLVFLDLIIRGGSGIRTRGTLARTAV